MAKLNNDMENIFCLLEGTGSHMAKGMDVHLLEREHIVRNNNKIHHMGLNKLKE